VVVAGGKEEDGLAARGIHDRLDVAHDQRAPRHAAQVDRLQMREQPVVALDGQHGLVRSDGVALVQGVDDELLPAVLPAAVDVAPRALLEDGDGLVDAAEDRLLLLEDLHQDARVAPLLDEELLGEVEVLVGVVAVADPLDRQAEDGRLQALLHDAHGVIL
jgi:hypothetical protein